VGSPVPPTDRVAAAHEPQPGSAAHRAWLRPRDQAVLAVVAAVAWLCLVRPSLRTWHGNWASEAGGQAAAPCFVVDINTASWPELAVLPGIGETLAQRIVEVRLQRGGYRSHEELLQVRGIGPKKFAGMQPLLAPLAAEQVPQP
jgi:competence ComEA-like helix-hairpin-helix protein